MSTTTNRATSEYRLLVPSPDPHATADSLVIAARVLDMNPSCSGVTGAGEGFVGYRATTDDVAVYEANRLLVELGLTRSPSTLQTGHGAHRRDVAV